MDFSSWQTWVFLAIGAIVVLSLIGFISDLVSVNKPARPPVPMPRPAPADPVEAQVTALAAHAHQFDRDMYIDDMTAEQLEDEHVWRTAFITGYNIVWNLGPENDNPIEKICTAITGRPADRQLKGLTEYYHEAVYEPMMGDGNDRYWDEELIGLKDQWTPQKREQVILAALVPLQMADALHIAIRGTPAPDDSRGAHLIPFIDRVGEAFFGDEAPQKMADLRRQAAELANQITV